MECPEEFTQGELTSNNWHLGLKITIAILTAGFTVLCLMMKLIFGVWLCWLNWKQNTYLDTLDMDEDEAEDKLQVRGMHASGGGRLSSDLRILYMYRIWAPQLLISESSVSHINVCLA